MALFPDDPEARLTRRAAAAALTAAGFPTAGASLATLASRGGGPVYRRYGPRALYRWGDLIQWAESRLTAPRRSTSEADAATPRGFGIPATKADLHAIDTAPEIAARTKLIATAERHGGNR